MMKRKTEKGELAFSLDIIKYIRSRMVLSCHVHAEEEKEGQNLKISKASDPQSASTSPSMKDEMVPREVAYSRYIAMLARSKKQLFYSVTKSISEQRALLAYQSEIGEASRPLANVWVIRGLYALSIGYVIGDIAYKAFQDYDNKVKASNIAFRAIDNTVWHAIASLILPTFTVHAIVKYSGIGLKKIPATEKYPKIRQWLPSLIGLVSIFVSPLPHYLDEGVTLLMDKTVRTWFKEQLEGSAEQDKQ